MTDLGFLVAGLMTGLTLGGLAAVVKNVLPPGRR